MLRMTDIPLDVLTGLLVAANFALAVAAVSGLKEAGRAATTAQNDAKAERKANSDSRVREFQTRIILEIAEAFEEVVSEGSASPAQRIRARLYALPIADLELLRARFNIFPSEDGSRRYQSFNDDGVRIAKIRDELAAKLSKLTGFWPQAHNPAANRPYLPGE